MILAFIALTALSLWTGMLALINLREPDVHRKEPAVSTQIDDSKPSETFQALKDLWGEITNGR